MTATVTPRARPVGLEPEADRRTWDDGLRARLPGAYAALAPVAWRLVQRLSRESPLRRRFVRRVVRRSYAAFNRGDLDALLPLYADDFVWDWSRFDGWPDEAVVRGADGLRRGFATFREAWHEFRVEPRDVVDCDDRLLLTCDMRTVGAGSGVGVERTWWQVATVRDGLCKSVQNFTERDEALRAAGLSPSG